MYLLTYRNAVFRCLALWCWKVSLVFACIILLAIISIYGTLVHEEAVISTQSTPSCPRPLWSLMLFAFMCILSQTSHASILPGLAGLGGCSDGQSLLGVNWETFSFLIDLMLENFENISWENFVLIVRIGKMILKFWK